MFLLTLTESCQIQFFGKIYSNQAVVFITCVYTHTYIYIYRIRKKQYIYIYYIYIYTCICIHSVFLCQAPLHQAPLPTGRWKCLWTASTWAAWWVPCSSRRALPRPLSGCADASTEQHSRRCRTWP